jgi:hypothetical protein
VRDVDETRRWTHAPSPTLVVLLAACLPACSLSRWQTERDERIANRRTHRRVEITDPTIEATREPDASTTRIDLEEAATCYRRTDRTRQTIDRHTLHWGWTILDLLGGATTTVGGVYLLGRASQPVQQLERAEEEDESASPLVSLGVTGMLGGLVWHGTGIYALTQGYERIDVLEQSEIEGYWKEEACTSEMLGERPVAWIASSGDTSETIHETTTDREGRARLPTEALVSAFADLHPLESMPTLRMRPGFETTERGVSIEIALPEDLRERLRQARAERAFQRAEQSQTLLDWLAFARTYPGTRRQETLEALERYAPRSDRPDLVLDALEILAKSDIGADEVRERLPSMLVEAREPALYRDYGELIGESNALRSLEGPLFETESAERVLEVLKELSFDDGLPEDWHRRLAARLVEANRAEPYRHYLERTERSRAVPHLREALLERGDPSHMLRALEVAAPQPDLLKALHDTLADRVREADTLELYRRYVDVVRKYNQAARGGVHTRFHDTSVLDAYVETWVDAKFDRYVEDYEDDGDASLPDPLEGHPRLEKQSKRQFQARLRQYHLESAREAKRAYQGSDIERVDAAIEHYERAAHYADDDRTKAIEREQETAMEAFRRRTPPSQVESDRAVELFYEPTIDRGEFARFLEHPGEFVGERVSFTGTPIQKISATTYLVRPRGSGVPIFVRLVNSKLTSFVQRVRLSRGRMNICAIVKGSYSYESRSGEQFRVPRVHAFWSK